jgi:STE24 endopeptidase
MEAESILILILVLIIVSFVFERILDTLNNKSFSSEIPEIAKGIFDNEKYLKAKNYNDVWHKFNSIQSVFSFVLIFIFIAGGYFGKLDLLISQYVENKILSTLVFFGLLAISSDIVTLPFQLYGTFKIEEKFGFNKTTLKTFFADKIKGYIIGIVIGGGLLALLQFIYINTQELFWILAWIVVSIFSVFMMSFYASLFLPLFNKLSPLPDGELKNEIVQFCEKQGFVLKNLFVMDGSKRSSKANAFFSGLGPKKVIVLYDTLIENHSKEELVAVLAHEIGHYKLKHTLWSLFFSIISAGLMFFLLSLVLGNDNLAIALGGKKESFALSLLAFGILYSPISLVTEVLMNIISRKNEFEADAYAAQNYQSKPLVEALKKLSSDNLSNLTPHPLYVFFHYSHPPLVKRIEKINQY